MPDSGLGWSNVVTWLLVFSGWIVVHKSSLSRERRKEGREAGNEAIIELRDIEAMAIRFHTAGTFSSLDISDLRSHVQRWIRKVQREPLSKMEVPTGKLVRLRRAITLNNADYTSFSSQPTDGELILDIRTAVDDLIDSIEQGRQLTFG